MEFNLFQVIMTGLFLGLGSYVAFMRRTFRQRQSSYILIYIIRNNQKYVKLNFAEEIPFNRCILNSENSEKKELATIIDMEYYTHTTPIYNTYISTDFLDSLTQFDISTLNCKDSSTHTGFCDKNFVLVEEYNKCQKNNQSLPDILTQDDALFNFLDDTR